MSQTKKEISQKQLTLIVRIKDKGYMLRNKKSNEQLKYCYICGEIRYGTSKHLCFECLEM